MSLSLVKAIFINRAPFKHLVLDFKEKGINVLSAINGKGKTTVLSHIVDAFYEMAKQCYTGSFEGKENKFYRFSSSIFHFDNSKYSIVYFRFKIDGEFIDYIDCRGKDLTVENYERTIQLENPIPFERIISRIQSNNCAKFFSDNLNKERVMSIFDNNILTYFPAYRYEQPYYLNDPYKFSVKFNIDSQFNGYLTNPIEVTSEMEVLANWIMDVVIDWTNYKQVQEFKLPTGQSKRVDVTPESVIFQNLNRIISSTLSSKYPDRCLRFGIGRRNNSGQRVSILYDNQQGVLFPITPNIFCLSSGELALLSLFGEILRQGDNIRNNIQLNQIVGIVLIDEVDMHLHIKLQKEILPELFNLFPNIQFIVSSHSPFLNMGLADTLAERSQIIDLDNNGIACSPTNNKLYKEVYELMIDENQRFADKYKELEGKILQIEKTVIISEGKTDWKHFKAALSHFKENHEFKDIDVEIVEYNFDFGDSKLNSLLTQYSLFPHKYKIIGIFDCDEANGKNIHAKGGKKQYGNNIWGMSIPVPDFREYNTSGISIEFLYHDEDLKRLDENGRRIFVTSEFNENGRLKSDPKIGVKNNHDVKNYVLPEKEKIQADEVIDIDGNSLALSKEQFATNILERNGNFSMANFDSFRPVFVRLRDIILQKD